MSIDIAHARNYIAALDLPDRPSDAVAMGAENTAAQVFVDTKVQAKVVGSEVVSFMTGVDADLRAAIADSALLAQLAATKKVADGKDVFGWYNAYFAVLRTLGWIVADSGFSEVTESGSAFEVHEQIMGLAAVLLGPAPAALAVVKATLDGLKAMKADSPWITIFDRETLHAEAARFQISVVQPDLAGDAVVNMIAFGITADKRVTQVLFFKIKKSKATLQSNSAKLSIGREALIDLAPDIRHRVRVFQRAFIGELEI
jgi:hypothetical protein